MTQPAKNVDGGDSYTVQFILNGVPHTVGTQYHTRWRRDICPASGNATRVKGFLLCRAWNHSFGTERVFVSGNGGMRTRKYSAGGQDVYTYPSGVDAWLDGNGVSSLVSTGLPSLPSSNMINATLVAALNKLKDQDIHVGNFLAEGHKTLEMVANAAKSIASGVQHFRRTNPKDWLQVTKTELGNLPREKWCLIPDKWLELQYGWKPLMSDIYGALHHLTRANRYKIPYVIAKAHRSSRSIFTKTGFLNGQLKPPGATPGYVATFDDIQDCWVQLVYGITSPVLAELSSLGLINPLEIVWELTRFSFVVDWFLPVGSWLSAMTAPVGFSFVTGSRSSMAKRTFRSSSATGSHPASVAGPSYTDFYEYPSVPTWGGENGQFERVCYTSSPVPGLYVKNPLSYDHVANGLSLLVQAFR